MNQLYPIIQRKRRPLIQENPEMLKAEMLKPESTPSGATPDRTGATPVPPLETSDVKPSSKRKAK
jgi:hypothetical protein